MLVCSARPLTLKRGTAKSGIVGSATTLLVLPASVSVLEDEEEEQFVWRTLTIIHYY